MKNLVSLLLVIGIISAAIGCGEQTQAKTPANVKQTDPSKGD